MMWLGGGTLMILSWVDLVEAQVGIGGFMLVMAGTVLWVMGRPI